MSQIEVLIGSPVVHLIKRELFEVRVSYMHGDADAYSTEVVRYPVEKLEPLKIALKGLHFMMDDAYQDLCQQAQRGVLIEKLEEFGFDREQIDSFTDAYVQHDTTDQSYDSDAAVDEVNVFYFDSHSIEHHVVVKINGAAL